jgi:SAM-dependent methyltransferase
LHSASGRLVPVVGLDCCGAFLDAGRADAKAAGLTNLTFLEADVQTCPFKPVHDFCFSRFGTQFFENPVAGLRNMRTALKPDGLMTMIVWRARADNPWLTLSKDVLLRYLPPVKEDAATCGPGPFSMTDTEAVTQQLQIAGYADARFERIDAEVLVGRDLDEGRRFQLAIGPAGEVYREAGEKAVRLHHTLVAALKDELREFARPEGVMMNSSSWMVTCAKSQLIARAVSSPPSPTPAGTPASPGKQQSIENQEKVHGRSRCSSVRHCRLRRHARRAALSHRLHRQSHRSEVDRFGEPQARCSRA